MSIKKTTKLSKLIFFSLIGLFVGGFAALRSQDKSGGNYSSILDYDKVYADRPVTSDGGDGGDSGGAGGAGVGTGDTGV